MRVIAITNQKGGVGKTTTTVNLAACLQRQRKKVLMIDLDPQAHLTNGLGYEPNDLEKTIYDLLKGEANLQDVILRRPPRGKGRHVLELVPANLDLTVADMELSGLAGREFIIKENLHGLTGYDYVLIDCPPSLGILTLNALTAASDIYVTMQPEYYALSGMSQLIRTVNLVHNRLNDRAAITGVIATLYDGRANLHKETLKAIRAHFGDLLFVTIIRKNISLAEAPSHGTTILEYAPESNGAADYLALSREIVKRCKHG